MAHLIACCDGTWQTARHRTNVHRLAEALAPTDDDGVEQRCQYFEGVGAGGPLVARATGGVAGAGISANVIEAYEWLANAYDEGDRIALFGFSRGAYTVRSLGGMISACGLVDLRGMAPQEARALVRRLYEEKYRASNKAKPSWRQGVRFRFDPVDKTAIPVEFIGVWDTVGSLGIPDHLGFVNLFDSPRRYQFHDVTLNPCIPHARQALALDEFRGPFTPTLWAVASPGQDVQQVWFPGDHSDVGGGHRETGLSDGALLWMMQEATAAVGLAFDKLRADDVHPRPTDRIHGGVRSVPGPAARLVETLFQPRPRAVPPIYPSESDPDVHASAYARQRQSGEAAYRPTQRLDRGGSATVAVAARDGWNETGLYLEAGLHRFTASGRWKSATADTGPEGERRVRLRPSGLGRMAGTLIGRAESLFRRFSGNQAAEFYGARREERLPWLSLVGVVANETGNVPSEQSHPHERIAIGAGVEHDLARPGYLYAFANDAWGFYNTNSGSVRLTVTRT